MDITGTKHQSSSPVSAGPCRLVLVSLEWHKPKRLLTPYATGCLAAAVREVGGIEWKILVRRVNPGPFHADVLAREIMDRNPTDVGIGAYVWSERQVGELSRALRCGGFRGRIILGGPQVTFSGPGLEEIYPEVDLFIRGYAEEALADLLGQQDAGQVRGVHVAGEEDRCCPAVPDLAALPSPYLTNTIRLDRAPDQEKLFAHWETLRGCPHNCAYCQHPGAGMRRQLQIPMERLSAEIALFKRRGVEVVDVLDPTFNQGWRSLEVLAELKRQEFEGRLRFECRFEGVNNDFLAGLEGLRVRPEFGLQTIHRAEEEAIRRPNDLGKVKEAMRELNGRRIRYQVSLIYGLPNQTLESFRESVAFCRRMKVPVIRAFPLLLLRGTELWKQKDRWGLVVGDGPFPEVVEGRTFSRQDRDEMAALAEELERNEHDEWDENG